VRRRRRELAILKTLGFVRSQVSATVAWQGSTLIGAALIVGIPLGIAAGRWSWTAFANQLGVAPDPVLHLSAVLLMIPAALLIGNAIAAVPGRSAARNNPAPTLHSE
jgi:ABC-type lipoprotein release transport system permease subunit